MICVNSEKTVEIIKEMIPSIREEWRDKNVFLPLKVENRSRYFKDTDYDTVFKDTGFRSEKNLKILFSHFPLLKHEMEALELPMYAAKVFPNSQIQTWYFDSRGNISPEKKGYIHNIKGCKSSPTDSFLPDYDLMITRSSTIRRMRSEIPHVLNKCRHKVNIQTNNHLECIGIGEDMALSHSEFFAPAGRHFRDRAKSNLLKSGFEKKKIISFIGSVTWWKGQAEWFENIDPDLVKDYIVAILGPTKNNHYMNRVIQSAKEKGISMIYSDYVHPDFLCDFLAYSSISIMNPFMEPPHQLSLGPARTVGEAIACNNLCVHGLSSDPVNGVNGKTVAIPHEWSKYVIEFDNTRKDEYNRSIESAINTDLRNITFSDQITSEKKSDDIFLKCMEGIGRKDGHQTL